MVFATNNARRGSAKQAPSPTAMIEAELDPTGERKQLRALLDKLVYG